MFVVIELCRWYKIDVIENIVHLIIFYSSNMKAKNVCNVSEELVRLQNALDGQDR